MDVCASAYISLLAAGAQGSAGCACGEGPPHLLGFELSQGLRAVRVGQRCAACRAVTCATYKEAPEPFRER